MGAFYDARVHASDAIPADAVPITERRHAELLAGRYAGREILLGDGGGPVLSPKPRDTVDQLRETALGEARLAARARILAIASLERQSNDNAAIALAAYTGNGDHDELGEAFARRGGIDAVRAMHRVLKRAIPTWSAAACRAFDADDAAHWPEA
jgi:hypothetical protein